MRYAVNNVGFNKKNDVACRGHLSGSSAASSVVRDLFPWQVDKRGSIPYGFLRKVKVET
jgi:hypothetical protein